MKLGYLYYMSMSVACGLIVALLMACRPSSSHADELQALRRADSLFLSMDWEKAVSVYEAVIKESSNEYIRLEADRGLLRIYELSARNEEYYECGGRMAERISRIEEEKDAKLRRQRGDSLAYEAPQALPPMISACSDLVDKAFRLNREGSHDRAIDTLKAVVDSLNAHHAAQYGHRAGPWMELQGSRDSTSAELTWYACGQLAPMQLVVRLREQLCIAYSGIQPPEREWSDYNRNAYLDILDITRQDREWESRVEALEGESVWIDRVLIVLAACLVAIIGLFALAAVRGGRQTGKRTNELRATLSLGLQILKAEEPVPSEGDEAGPTPLLIRHCRQFDARCRGLMSRRTEELDEARAQLEPMALKREEDKRENIVKKACFSVVSSLLPIVDRLRLNLQSPLLNEYVRSINEYNDILTRWIEMRPGVISLKIESFDLSELFALMEKGAQAFRMKGLTLNVVPTDLTVKADKALTLFMINTLADNARKFTPEGGRVELKSERVKAEGEAEYVEISVTDTGIGLSEEEQDRVMGRKTEGSGFGLMNCRGIVEQYRKSGPLFSVCRIGVESSKGRGSRFYFRLPVGLRRAMMMLALAVCLASCGSQDADDNGPMAVVDVDTLSINPADTTGLLSVEERLLLDSASLYADAAYYSNLDGSHEFAICYIDSAIMCLNEHYRLFGPGTSSLLRLHAPIDQANIDSAFTTTSNPYSTGLTREREWWNEGFETDYHIILDIRNEAAVAFLALNRWDDYAYNNEAYTELYRLLSEDDSLAIYFEELKRKTSNKQVGIGLDILLMALLLYSFYLLFVRKRLAAQWSLEQTVENCDRLLTSAMKKGEKLQDISEQTSGENPADSLTGDDEGRRWLAAYAQALTLRAIAQPEAIRRQTDAVHDELARLRYEDSTLHVQNRVLDNCLSTIKHETVYYPNKIRQLVERLGDKELPAEQRASTWQSIGELLTYYRGMIHMLGSCAGRQTEQVTFRRGQVEVGGLTRYALQHFSQVNRTEGLTLSTHLPTDARIAGAEATQTAVLGDEVLLRFLIDCLIDEALSYLQPGELSLQVTDEGDRMRFVFTDSRRSLSDDELNNLFAPRLQRMKSATRSPALSTSPPGTEYLVCKQIIREHDEYGGPGRGCHINARQTGNNGRGFEVFFTLRKK